LARNIGNIKEEQAGGCLLYLGDVEKVKHFIKSFTKKLGYYFDLILSP